MKIKLIKFCGFLVAPLVSAFALNGQSPLLSISGSSDTLASHSCGVKSLYEVARVLKPDDANVISLLSARTKGIFVSMAELGELARGLDLGLVAVRRRAGDQLPVPSVAHWGREHFVAILEKNGQKYLVLDPALASARWLTADQVNAQISGHFLAPKAQLTGSWNSLTLVETEQIVGNLIDVVYGDDPGEEACPKDEGSFITKCPTCQTNDDCQPGNNDFDDAGCSSCGTATDFTGYAMPVWKVTEPNINLWIADIPLFYTTSHDDQLIFKLTYKQRNSRSDTGMFGVGNLWECNWLTYAEPDSSNTNKYKLSVPGGGQRDYQLDVMDYLSTTVISSDGSVSAGVGMRLPRGEKNDYTFPFTNSLNKTYRFIAKKTLSDGRTIQFNYLVTNSVCLLTNLIDPDGLTNIVRYQDSNFPYYISEVENPYGRKATLKYDSSGNLTNIVDMINFTNSFQYNSQGLITNMTTPYGATTFQTTTNSTSEAPNRSVLVTEPNGAHQLYLYRAAADQLNPTNNTPLIPDSYPLPDTTPFSNTFETSGLGTRDSFYWGRQQYAALSASFRTNTPLNFNNLTTNDYNLARMKHWLYQGQSAHLLIGQTMSLLRMPSPDGVTEGQKIWYDYAGTVNSGNEGTNSRPSLIARILPDSTTQFIHIDRTNYWRKSTQIVGTYSTIGTNVYLRTNTISYATNSIDLLEVRGPTNELLVAYGNYNAYHQPGVITNALGEVTTVTYNNTNHQIIRIQWPSGLTTTNIYFTSGATNFLQQTKDLETTNSVFFTYDKGLVNTFTDARGLQVTLNWDALERLTNAAFPNGTITLTYNKLDLSSFTDRLTNTYNFSYNQIRQLTQTVDPLSRTNTYSYCDCGNLNSITDPLGRTTSFFYDTGGRRTNTIYPGGYSITNLYSRVGRLTNVTDNAGNSVTNWYSNQGLLTASSNAFGQIFSAVYDVKNRATNTVGSTGVAINQTFDLLNRISTRTWPDNGVEKFFYTARGLTNYTDQLTNITTFYWNEAGWLTKQIFLTSGSTPVETNRFEYHESGDLLRLYDGKDQVTSWNYDEYGRVTNKVDAANITDFVFKYDPNDRLTNRIDALSRQTTYRFDAVGNLTNIDYAVSPDITLKYDALDRITNMVDGVGTTLFSYDANGLLASEDGPWANDTVSYGYTIGRQRSSLTLQQPNASSWAQSYLYDAIGRLTNVVSPAGSFGYDYSTGVAAPTSASTLIKKLSLPGGSYITNAFDSIARLLSTSLKNSGGTVLNSHAYVYDLDGERTKQTFKDGNYFDYTYDALGRLKTALGKESGGSNRLHEQFKYGYDYARNLNYRTNNSLSQTFGVNNLNQLTNATRSGTLTVGGTTTSAATNVTVNSLAATRYTDNTFAKDGFSLADGNNTFTAIAQDSNNRKDTNAVTLNLPATATFQYDTKGNITSDGRRGLDFDDENQLIRITVTNYWKTEFSYDGLFRRRIREEFSWQNSTWTKTEKVHYVYDGRLLVQERDGNNMPLVSYTRGSDLAGSFQGAAGIGGLLARTDHSTINLTHAFYHADGNGNITALLNDKQLIVAHYTYDPFGNTSSKSGPLADLNSYRFSSQDYHAISGLYYYLYRFYDPNLQRWLSRDPAGELAGVNLYQFVGNSPSDVIDPLGLDWHHLLPRAIFKPDVLKALGLPDINIHDSQWGWDLQTLDHQDVHPEWNRDWQKWVDRKLQSGKKVSEAELRMKVTQMKNKYGLKKLGKPVTCNYFNRKKSVLRRGAGSGPALAVAIAIASAASSAAAADELMDEIHNYMEARKRGDTACMEATAGVIGDLIKNMTGSDAVGTRLAYELSE
jgi:RHS repeat-associated protein